MNRTPRTMPLYSPGGCGCAVMMLPFMAIGVGITAAAIGYAVFALVLLAAAIASTIILYRQTPKRRSEGKGLGAWVAIPIVLYLVSVPYLLFFLYVVIKIF